MPRERCLFLTAVFVVFVALAEGHVRMEQYVPTKPATDAADSVVVDPGGGALNVLLPVLVVVWVVGGLALHRLWVAKSWWSVLALGLVALAIRMAS